MSDNTPQSQPDVPPAPPAPSYPAAYAAPTPDSSYQAASPQPPAPAYPGYPSAPSYPEQNQGYPQQSAPYGYGAPAYPYPAGPKTNGLAITSLVSAIAAFVVLPFIASIVAVITGHIALKQLRTSGEGGRGLALWGTIIGWVGIGLAVIGIILFVIWMVTIFSIAGSSNYTYS